MTRLPATRYSISLLSSLALAIPLSGFISVSTHADTGASARPAVEVNLQALKYSNPLLNVPTRIIDGESVIILTPPSMKKNTSSAPAQEIVTPLIKPALSLPETAVAAAPPVPVPPLNPAKLPELAEKAKFEDVATPVVKMDTAPIPTPDVAEETKSDVATLATDKLVESADTAPEQVKEEPAEAPQTSTETMAATQADTAEKQTKTLAEEEVKLAAIAPDAGTAASTTSSGVNDNITRILFAEGVADLPKEAQTTLQVIADQFKDGDRRNVQLLAYGSGNSVSAARRLSLGRALAIRSKLMELGVNNRQIEVRALGEPEGDGPSDRVDLLMITR